MRDSPAEIHQKNLEEAEEQEREKLRIKAAILRISRQAMPLNNNGRLMLAVIVQALGDLAPSARPGEQLHRDSAKAYLRSDMVHANLIGLNPDWIRSTLKALMIYIK